MRLALWLLVLCAACRESTNNAERLRTLAPAPLPQVVAETRAADGGRDAEREALHQVEPAEVYGAPIPSDLLELKTQDTKVSLDSEWLDAESPETGARIAAAAKGKDGVLVRMDPEAYLALLASLFSQLEDAGLNVWLAHPQAAFAYPVRLRDEPGFRAWLDEAKPGKIRIIQRADGFELQTNVGKLPGADRNGPTVPARGGQLDIVTLRRGLVALKSRFKTARDVCLVPSFGTEARAIATALSGMYSGKDEPFFDELCLVYPRPTRGGDR